ncbi:uncharacterized protein LOC129592250 [Paramacrobiotus metropolitanus]|uniref:uncharacterized protein LOC129592250 n=1 Tax=Paramacrobiotus metropolitanus TaxID=2943436 RepID=UPI0024461CB8|nr:uncharacterized protein LOC129592250 [Paramacrobiotus metropolitanus]
MPQTYGNGIMCGAFGIAFAGYFAICSFALITPAEWQNVTEANEPQRNVTFATADNFIAANTQHDEPASADVRNLQQGALTSGDSGNGTLPTNASCPPMVSRAEWNARDPIYNNQTEVKIFLQFPLRYMVYTQTVTGTTVHGTCTDRESCKKTVRAIQDDHMGFTPASTTKFADIGYHFLIAMDGSVFEGRGWLVKGSYYKPLNTQGFGVAFIGTFPEAGTSVAPLTYEAVLSAHRLLRCALSEDYLVSVNYSVMALHLSPIVSQYIDNPDTFPRDSPLLTPAMIVVVSIGCTVALVFIIVFGISSWRKSRASIEQEPLMPEAQLYTNYQSANQGAFLPQADAYKILGSDCRYQYLPNEVIGSGSAGTVYKARITDRGTYTGDGELAVKVIHMKNTDERETEAEQLRKFSDKWKKLISLNCTHLVACHKISIYQTETGFSVEILMDYCNGRDLEQLLSRIKTDRALLDRGTALCYALQIVNGVEFLHERQLMHGDLKPGNVFVKYSKLRHFTLVLGDLDCLVHMPHNTITATQGTNILGTAKYMSPERVRRNCHGELQVPSKKADIWSVGCIMLDLFDYSSGIYTRKFQKAGSPPEEPDTILVENMEAQVLIMRIMNGYVPFVSDRLDPRLSNIISQCLIVDSTKRPSAGEIHCNLVSLLVHIATHQDRTFISQMEVTRQCVCGSHLAENSFNINS